MADNQNNEIFEQPTPLDDGNWTNRARGLTRIAEAGTWLADATSVYQDICVAIASAFECDSVFMHLLTATGDSMVRYGSDMRKAEKLSEWGNRLPRDIGRIAQIFNHREPIIMDYTRPHEKDRVPQAAIDAGYRSAISVPVIAGDEIFGIYSISFLRSIEWDSDAIEYLEQIGRIVGTTVKRVRASKNFSELALLEERQRLSAEIHDNVSHHLGSLSLCAASVLESYEEGDDSRVQKGLEKLESICGETMRVFRDEMLSLRAPLQRTDEWLQAVAHILNTFENEWGIQTTLEENVKNKPLSLNLQSSLQLTRILNECLSNVLRHAKATQVRVSLYEDGSIMNMRVEDNGRGFDARDVSPERLGLKIMRERAAAMGGTLTILSSSRGTAVIVEVPRIGKS